MHQETHARITTQLALRDTATSFVDIRKMADQRSKSITTDKKISRKTMMNMAEKLCDKAFSGNLINKAVGKASKRKTCNHRIYEWIYLHYDPERPYTRREEHLIPIRSTQINSRKPNNSSIFGLNIFVSRHFLERSALRLNATSVTNMVDFIGSYIMVMVQNKMRVACHKGNGLVLISRSEYVIVDCSDAKSVILKTVLPRKEWSKAKVSKLSLVMKELDLLEGEALEKSYHSIAAISVDKFNSLDALSTDDFNIISQKNDY